MIILQKAIITEKSMKLAGDGLYTFLVSKQANKQDISKAVKDLFKVDVLNVQTINVKGEIKWQRRVRRSFKSSSFKKALVQVKKGQIIPIFEAPKEEEVVVTTAEGEPKVIKEKRNLLRNTKIKVEKSQIAQRDVVTGKGGDK